MPPRDPPSDRFLRGKALEQARAREQAETGRLPGYQDYAGRETTRPGPHVDPLDATAEDFPGPLTPVDALTDAAIAVGDAAQAIAAHTISRRESEDIRRRLAALEIWRAGDVDPWRLRLTGVADTNGRMGRLDNTVAQLREDVGPSEERRKEREAVATQRGDRKRVVAAIIAAATLSGGGLYTIRDQYDAAAEARGAAAEQRRADDEWRRGVDASLRALFGMRSLP